MATNKAGSPTYSYTVAPHLVAEFDVPIADFAAAHRQYNYFIVGGFVFTNRKQKQHPPASASSVAKKQPQQPLMLIMQRSLSDSFGGYWDFPGGSLEPTDQTILDGVAREVFEETGFHVSKIRDLVRLDHWVMESKSRGIMSNAKYTFLIDVHEAADTEDWEEKVRLDPAEHMKWAWVTREEIEESAKMRRERRSEDVPYLFVGVQGDTTAEAWKIYSKVIKGSETTI
ncbi:NUDIX domain protein [Talaromyces proteolyticus]|uniref:NUDIX domain protein n=1 Tax=Talaromyces proteolyticus TaxID=1131652 RepID=A0AAD4KQ60_9EURO|nr:NUDIX domain protein [Talaromyces proteolyticus]KAH8697852.1 NUDIX domain protein [Talaromyces proteolyticus]